MKEISKIIFVFLLILIIQSAYVYHYNIVDLKSTKIEIVSLELEEKQKEIEVLKKENDTLSELLELRTLSRQKKIINIVSEEPIVIPSPSPSPIPSPTPIPAKKTDTLQVDDTFKWFSYLLMREAGGENDEMQLAVGQVIINRSKTYKKTITQTIFEKNSNGYYVFSPVAKTNFYSTKPTDRVIKNSKYILSGGKYLLAEKCNTLYFCTSQIYKPGNWHYDASIGSGKHTIKEDFRIERNKGGYVIFFSPLK